MPAKIVAPEVSKPIDDIKQVAEETVEEAIITAAKSIDEKINVNKPEVNDNDLQQNVQNADTLEQNNENAIVDTNLNNADASVSLGDCTNNNNPNPPPLPDCKPPSQISVFAETALAEIANTNLNQIDETISINQSNNEIIPESNIVIQSETTTEISKPDEISVPPIIVETVVESLGSNNESESIIIKNLENPELDAITTINDIIPKPDEIAETIAMLDSVNESEIKTPDEPTVLPPQIQESIVEVTEPNKDEVSVDISSPLQQNSIESLPSPQSLSPSEIDENTATELINEDNPLLPPPPPQQQQQIDEELDSSVATDVPIEHGAGSVIDDEASQSEQLPPPPPPIDDDNDEKLNGTTTTTNGNGEHKTNGDHIDEITDTLISNGCHLNGDSRVNDVESAANLSEKVINPTYETK